jgi:hypothetical protein
MGIVYNSYIPSIDYLVAGYSSQNPKSYSAANSYLRSFVNSYNIYAPTIIKNGEWIYLNDSEYNNATGNLSLNTTAQISIAFTTYTNSSESDKKGTYFGYSEGSQYYVASSKITSDPHTIVDHTAISADTTVSYTASSKIANDPHTIVDHTAISADTTVSYTASSKIANDPHTIVDHTATATNITVNYEVSGQIANSIHSTATTYMNDTQWYADYPDKSILFKLDRGGGSVFCRLKDGDSEINTSVEYIPNSIRDTFVVILEKYTYNKVSIYLNNTLIVTSSTSSNIQNFPSGAPGMHLMSNGVGCDNLGTGLGSFYLYKKKLSTTEIFNLTTSLR